MKSNEQIMSLEGRERHAKDFLDYVVANDKQLRKNLRKNITYNPDFFDDIFNDSIIKVYDYIMKHGKRIANFEDFFFIVSKNKYIQEDNADKKRKKNSVEISSNLADTLKDETKIDRSADIDAFILWLSGYLEKYFDASEVDLFIIYFRLKVTKNKISYQKLAKITNTPYFFVATKIKEIKDFVNFSGEIAKKKKEYLFFK